MTMKKMLETSFPGIDVILSNYPPAFPKRVLGKVVPVLQIGVIAIITAGDQIFPRLGMAPPPWYFSLRANRFGAIASTWLFGNFLQSTLQSSGAFEVYCDGELVRDVSDPLECLLWFLVLPHHDSTCWIVYFKQLWDTPAFMSIAFEMYSVHV